MTVGPIPGDQIETAAAETDPPQRGTLVEFVRRPLPMQVLRFSAVGIVCTTTYALLYLTLHGPLGAQAANFIAMLVSAILNTAANRAFTFGLRGSRQILFHHIQGIAVFAFGWALTALSLFVLHQISEHPSSRLELVILMIVNLIATCVRFLTFRHVFSRALRKQLTTAG
ncbi:GtrA family protein [Nocardia sp. 348MFTsu5.1]|uniref:GtrA family protein n=1 Tax=Nocardia sp. 348MFTsu5.1 TaxID=1172185 RepID=UPI0018CA2681|nr:GtrA family protein [Nocardia sp. 348MFTsu5.1]